MSSTNRPHFPLFASLLMLCLALGGFGACKSEQAPAPKSAPPAAPAPQNVPPGPQGGVPPPQQPAFRVTRIDLGNAIGADKRVTAPSYIFKPNDTIYASILTEGAAPSVALKVRWTFEDGQVVNESTQNIAPTGPTVTDFHIAKPDGWPAGKYKIEISTNGKPAGALDFTVGS